MFLYNSILQLISESYTLFIVLEFGGFEMLILQNGVRGLMLDMYDFNNDVWLCHSFGGTCYNYTAFVSILTKFRNGKELTTLCLFFVALDLCWHSALLQDFRKFTNSVVKPN